MEKTQRRYSPELKQRLVEELEAGQLSVRDAARDARTSVAMIYRWVEEFGRY
ncbi:MAG: transposase [Gemmatimonadetes bacterium]|nr:transposase [Gemmatimonadota bacterium]